MTMALPVAPLAILPIYLTHPYLQIFDTVTTTVTVLLLAKREKQSQEPIQPLTSWL